MSARGITIEGRWADLNRGGGMAAKAKVFMVNQEYKADKKVYFVPGRFLSESSNGVVRIEFYLHLVRKSGSLVAQ